MIKSNGEMEKDSIPTEWGDVWPKYKSCFAMPVTDCPVIHVADSAKEERESYLNDLYESMRENFAEWDKIFQAVDEAVLTELITDYFRTNFVFGMEVIK